MKILLVLVSLIGFVNSAFALTPEEEAKLDAYYSNYLADNYVLSLAEKQQRKAYAMNQFIRQGTGTIRVRHLVEVTVVVMSHE